MPDGLFPGNVAAVVVTYGARFNYLQTVVHGILNTGITCVLVVDNGSPDDNRKRINKLCAAHSSQVTCLRLDENLGSAE